MQWEKQELGVPVNPVERHISFGGRVAGNILVGSVNNGEQGLFSFDI